MSDDTFDQLQEEIRSHPPANNLGRLDEINGELKNWLSSSTDAELFLQAIRSSPMSQGLATELAKEATDKLNARSFKSLGVDLFGQDHTTTDRVWIIVMWSVSSVVVVTVLAIAYCAVRQVGDTQHSQTLLTIFTTAIGFLGGTGLFSSAAGRRSRRIRRNGARSAGTAPPNDS